MKKSRKQKEVFVSVDVEAAGPIPGSYSMLSLGACVVGATSKTFYVELKPITCASVTAAMAVVGRTLDDFERVGVPPREAMRRFSRWTLRACKGGRPVFVGFNATFDWAFVNWYFHTYLGTNPFGYGGLDIKAYYMGSTGCSWEETRSSQVPKALGGGQVLSHNALEDAIVQAKLFESIRAPQRVPRSSRKGPETRVGRVEFGATVGR